MNVYDQTHVLAQAIKASDEFKEYSDCKKTVKENPELEQMIKDFQARQFEIQAKQMTGEQLAPEDMAAVQQLYAILVKDPVAAKYVEAEMRFSIMMKDVYEILGEATGLGDMLG